MRTERVPVPELLIVPEMGQFANASGILSMTVADTVTELESVPSTVKIPQF
jgi:hypothetical protein